MMDIGVSHLIEAAIKLECSMETTTRGLILYHHFIRCVEEDQYNKTVVAATALNVSGRLNDEVIDFDSLILVFFSIVNQSEEVHSPANLRFVWMKKTIIVMDFLLIRTLEFNLTHCLPHQYLFHFLTLIFNRSRNIAEFRYELSNTAIRLISDFYSSRNVLNYLPQHIAIACIDLTLYIHGMVNDIILIPVWYQGLCSDLTPEKVGEIKNDMLGLYKYDKAESCPSAMKLHKL